MKTFHWMMRKWHYHRGVAHSWPVDRYHYERFVWHGNKISGKPYKPYKQLWKPEKKG